MNRRLSMTVARRLRLTRWLPRCDTIALGRGTCARTRLKSGPCDARTIGTVSPQPCGASLRDTKL